MHYIWYSYNKVSYRKANVIKKNPKEEKIHLRYLLGEKVHISGAMQFKAMLLTGHPYTYMRVCRERGKDTAQMGQNINNG